MQVKVDWQEGINITKSRLRLLSEIVFLLLFSFIFWQGRVQMWALFWAAGVLFSFVFSRAYCGWACPIGTIMRFQSWLYDKLGIERPKITNTTLVTLLRLIIVAVFFAGMYAVRVLGWQINIILIVLGSGVISSFFVTEDFWHRLCPHGTVLNISTRTAPLKMSIDEDECTGCGLCEEACPNESIDTVGTTDIRHINKSECLTCHDCEKACPVDAIDYGSDA